MKKYICVFIVVLGVFLAIGCTGSNTDYKEGNTNISSDAGEQSNESTVQASETPEQPALNITSHTLSKQEYGGYIVKGTATSSRDLGYAEVKVKFYDDSGSLIDSGIANINDLGAGEKWNFEVYCLATDKHVADYKIAVGNCF
jgi:hypothetical protein